MVFGQRFRSSLLYATALKEWRCSGWCILAAMSKTPPKRTQPDPESLSSEWRDVWLFVNRVLADTVKISVVVLALLWFTWLLGLGKLFGMSDENAHLLELIHSSWSYAVMIVLALDFLWNLVVSIVRRRRVV